MSPLRRITTTLLLASFGGLSGVALSACESGDTFGGDAEEQVELSVTERDLDPGRVVVDSGEIEFKVRNEGDRVHAFAVNTKGGVERTKTIKPGETGSLTVDLSPGRYEMYDPRGGYRMRGVSGTIVVRSKDRDRDDETVTERTVERTVVEEPDIDVPEVDEPETQEPEVQEPQAPPPVQPPPPPARTVTVQPPPVEEQPSP